ncbi:hypothetical protein BDB00DRAFT_827079 [Zychaea mexicana]|uniref:uncharacterized protein n=1 Tax=Zychaea mexicana TaxID=64656 RepID=UPI0022FF03C0|nr:uncharacterized protein BDB00DRAFT_827079 [Zychaea mexicana]KAI9492752.1 hypothetical protein BDB00DRAFT_827079 [Zychaea mexicana]
MVRYWLFALFLLCSVYTVNARSDDGGDVNLQQQQQPLLQPSSVTFSIIDHHHQQQVYNSNVDKDDDFAHVTYWGIMFFSPPWLINTTLLWVTGIISAIVWCSGYTIECLLDRQERLAMELGKQKQQVSSYGALEA